jgi:hypothetical protein
VIHQRMLQRERTGAPEACADDFEATLPICLAGLVRSRQSVYLSSHFCFDFRMQMYAKLPSAQNFVVPASSPGALGPRPASLTPGPQATFTLRPSQYRERPDL